MLLRPGRIVQILSPCQDSLCLVLSFCSELLCFHSRECGCIPPFLFLFSVYGGCIFSFPFSPKLFHFFSLVLFLSLQFLFLQRPSPESPKIDNSCSLVLFPAPHCHSPASTECKHVRIQAMLVQIYLPRANCNPECLIIS